MKCPIAWIIDDDLVAQYAATYRIGQTNRGYSVICHDSVEKALEALTSAMKDKNGVPDIVLLDLSFPRRGGWHFLEELERWEPEMYGMRIYKISAFTSSKDRRIAAGHSLVKGYFDKPLSPVSLDTVFNQRLNGR